MKILAQDRAAFANDGIICIKNSVAKTSITPTRDAIFRELTRIGLRKDGKWHTKMLDGISPFQVTTKIGQKLKHQKEFDAVLPKDLLPLLEGIAGCKLIATPPQILITPPQKLEWSIPSNGWHVDVASPTANKIPGIQVFILLDEVVPRGGGTMAVKGSHLMEEKIPSLERILEMSGRASDLYIMDMRLLHAPSINSSTNARMMLTRRFLASW